jgi:hypothetical protein
MDAPHDRDIELQRESGDLIKDLQTKLPPLLWKSASDSRPHRWAKAAKTDKLIALVSYLSPFHFLPLGAMNAETEPDFADSLSHSKNGHSFSIRIFRDSCHS